MAACTLLWSGAAWAKTSEVYAYRYEQVWPTAVRYLVVDEKSRIVEKDEEAGYILFEMELDDGGVSAGSMELIRAKDPEGRQATRVTLTLQKRPSYVERMLLDRLARKLREEQGEPADPPPPPPPKGDGKGNEGKEDDKESGAPPPKAGVVKS